MPQSPWKGGALRLSSRDEKEIRRCFPRHRGAVGSLIYEDFGVAERTRLDASFRAMRRGRLHPGGVQFVSDRAANRRRRGVARNPRDRPHGRRDLGLGAGAGRHDPSLDPERRAEPAGRFDEKRGATGDGRVRRPVHYPDDFEDDRSMPDGAAQAAQTLIGAGAQLVLGPVYANDVRQAAGVAKAAGKPIIAFSTDASVAAANVYLLSFLIEGYVDRIVDFANSRGKKAFVVMAPQNDYGNIALAEFQQRAGRLNTPVVAIARYAPGHPQNAAQEISGVAGQIDALFIPEQADGMPGVAEALSSNGIKTQLLGTGVWNDARVLRLPQLQGAWFSAPDNSGFNALAQRYKSKFNADPVRLATLSYDAVTLAGALARSPDRFSQRALTNVSGFNGADGVFRFRADGVNERGLAVMEIDNNAAVVISPAPTVLRPGEDPPGAGRPRRREGSMSPKVRQRARWRLIPRVTAIDRRGPIPAFRLR